MVKLLIYSPLTTPNGQGSGAERVLCRKLEYLKDCPQIETYLSYYLPQQFQGTRLKEAVIERPGVETLRQAVIDHGIDVVMVPNGEANAMVVRAAVEGLPCKVICELHNVPLHELHNADLHMLRYRWKKAKCAGERVKTAIKIILHPLYYRFQLKLYKQQYLNTYCSSDRYVLLSRSFIPQLKKAIGIDDAEHKLCAIGNPLSFDRYADAETLSGKEKRVLVVARMSEISKRISLAIKVWSKLEKEFPEWHFDVVGDGEDLDYYKKLARKLSLRRIEFHGSQPPEEYYRRASVFLMTSAFEGWGMTLTEAMQNGCVPVVMDSFTAVHDIITHGRDGFIVPPRNVEAMFALCRRLLADDITLRTVRSVCVESSKRFSLQNIGPQWVDLYTQTAK